MTHTEAVDTLATERYLLGEMNDTEREAFEAHYFDCADCADEVRVAASLAEGVRAGLLPPTTVQPFRRPAKRPPAGWLRSPVLPWAVAASLAMVAVYEAVPTRQASAPATAVALAPVTLRPMSRGEEARVGIGPDDRSVTLAVDIPVGAPSGRLGYTLRVDGGREVVAGEVPAPQPGFPLLLLVPASLLTPSTAYVLAVRDAANASLTGAEYRFTVLAR